MAAAPDGDRHQRRRRRRPGAALLARAAAKVGSTAIKLDGAELGHGGAPILSDVSLRVARGARLLLLGPNGAGKSTLLHGLAAGWRRRRARASRARAARRALLAGSRAGARPGGDRVDEVLRRAPAADEQGARDALGALDSAAARRCGRLAA